MNKKQLEAEIDWLTRQIHSKKCTKKQIKEYKRQIRHKQLTITLNEDKKIGTPLQSPHKK